MSTALITTTNYLVSTSTLTDNATAFAGFQVVGSSADAFECYSNATLTMTGTVADCCSIGDSQCLGMARGCAGSTAKQYLSSIYNCTSGLICLTDFLYSQYPTNSAPVKSAFRCGDGVHDVGVDYYLTVLSSTTTGTFISTITSVVAAAAAATSTLTSAASTGRLLSTTRPSSASTASAQQSSVATTDFSSLSTGAIAGIVVGAVAAAALLAALVWYLLRKRRQQNNPSPYSYDNKMAPVMSPTMSTNGLDTNGRTSMRAF